MLAHSVRVRKQQHIPERHLLICAAIAPPHVSAPTHHLRVPAAPQLTLPQLAQVLLLRRRLTFQELLELGAPFGRERQRVAQVLRQLLRSAAATSPLLLQLARTQLQLESVTTYIRA